MTLKKFEGTGGVVGFPYFVPHVTQVVGQQSSARGRAKGKAQQGLQGAADDGPQS